MPVRLRRTFLNASKHCGRSSTRVLITWKAFRRFEKNARHNSPGDDLRRAGGMKPSIAYNPKQDQMDQHVGKISRFDVVVSQEKGGCMPTHDSPRTPKPSTESHVPRRPPEVDQF